MLTLPLIVEFAFGSQDACIDLDIPEKYTTGQFWSSSGPGPSTSPACLIEVTVISMIMRRMASVVSIGGRGLPGPGSPEAKL
jgi:hypothetical protein